MAVFNLVFDLPTSHRNVLDMVFRVIQIRSHEADFLERVSVIFQMAAKGIVLGTMCIVHLYSITEH